jgi:uncharacterized membrane protein
MLRFGPFRFLRAAVSRRSIAAFAGLVAVFGFRATPAAADFRLCNNTGSRVGIAIGYKDGEAWITEGWWNLSSRSCETILRGALSARFYYIYGVDYDRGGEWSGKAYMCTRDKEFTIRGIDDCLARGYDRTGFFEVDTSEQKSWTVQLTESADQAPARPLQPPYRPQRPGGAAPGRTSSDSAPPVPAAGASR